MSGFRPVFPRIGPLGDQALTIAFADRLDPTAAAQVTALGHRLAAAGLPGIVEVVPGYVALTVHYRPDQMDYQTLRGLVSTAAAAPATPTERSRGQLIKIPVHYDGPDLAEVASATGLTTDQVIGRHSGREYRVALLGFVPGFAYLGELDPSLVLPRRQQPRPRVPPGSVAIAGEQTGVYPAATPGGWHLIGRTEVRTFDPARSAPSLLAVGDRVRFVPNR